MSETIRTGGCQCGAIRFRALGDEFMSTICHCRMCQKQTGGYFGALATYAKDKVEWTRGALSHFQSSNIAKRGFCKDCGTPLSYEFGTDEMSVALGAFDDPSTVAPTQQLAHGDRIKSFDSLHELPIRPDDQDASPIENHQHPDHDTAEWPAHQD